MSALFKQVLRSAVRMLPLRYAPLDGMLRISHRASATLAGLLYLRDWRLQAKGRPKFFKHRINLGRWASDPSKWSFVSRGVYARERMFRGCRVLDLCCGDGSFSYLFFSDIAGRIDAVDSDRHAIDYARKFSASSVITYHELDIVNQPWPGTGYDFIVWNAAICYFTEEEIARVFEKILAAGSPAMTLNGMLPRANAWVDHKTEFADAASVDRLVRRYFKHVSIHEVDEVAETTFYFRASEPIDPGTVIHSVLDKGSSP